MDFYVGLVVFIFDDLMVGVMVFIDFSVNWGLYIWGGFLDMYCEELCFVVVEVVSVCLVLLGCEGLEIDVVYILQDGIGFQGIGLFLLEMVECCEGLQVGLGFI